MCRVQEGQEDTDDDDDDARDAEFMDDCTTNRGEIRRRNRSISDSQVSYTDICSKSFKKSLSDRYEIVSVHRR